MLDESFYSWGEDMHSIAEKIFVHFTGAFTLFNIYIQFFINLKHLGNSILIIDITFCRCFSCRFHGCRCPRGCCCGSHCCSRYFNF